MRWDLAWVITFLPEPPLHLMTRQPPESQLRPFGRLTHPTWSAAQLAFVKDCGSLAELRKKNFTSKGDGKGDRDDAAEGRGRGRGAC